MRIFLLRHGIAADVSAGGPRTDEERPLTAEGREVMHTACKSYVRHVSTPERIISSPLLRARQTAEILSQAVNYQGVIEQVADLEPGARPTSILNFLQGEALEGLGSVVLVGHEPHLGSLLGLLLTGLEQVSLPLQKGMISGVDIPHPQSMLGRMVLCLSSKSTRA